MENTKTLGETLRALRVQKGFTQTDLGAKLNISAQAISKWERDESQPDIETLKKLAEIYEITVTEIIDPDSVVSKEPTESTGTVSHVTENVATPTCTAYTERYDLYLSGDFTTNARSKLLLISHMGKKFKTGLAERKMIAENSPYALTGGVTEEEADMLTAHFAEIGVTVTRERTSGNIPNRPLITEDDIRREENQRENNKVYLKKRFIAANITAIVPAIVATILLIINKQILFDNALLGIYCGLCVYSTIFLLWYPSLVRGGIDLIFELGAEVNGCLLIVPKLIFSILFIAVILIISPLVYIISLRKRIVRMNEGNMEDNIFD